MMENLKYSLRAVANYLEKFMRANFAPETLRTLETAFFTALGILGIIAAFAAIGRNLRRHEESMRYREIERTAKAENATPEELIARLRNQLADAEARAAQAEAELARMRE